MSLEHHIAKVSSPLFMFILFMIGTLNLAFANSAAQLIILNQPIQIGSDSGSGSQLLSNWLSSHCPPGSPACTNDVFTFGAQTIVGSGIAGVPGCAKTLNVQPETCQLMIKQSNYPNDSVRMLLINALLAAVQKGQTQRTINGFSLERDCTDTTPPKCTNICGIPQSVTSWSTPGQQRIIAYNKPLNEPDTAEQGEIWYTINCAADTISASCPQGLTNWTSVASGLTGVFIPGGIPGLINGLVNLYCTSLSDLGKSPMELRTLTPVGQTPGLNHPSTR